MLYSKNQKRDILKSPFSSGNQKIKNLIIGLSLSCSVLFMASCQKEETPGPVSDRNSSRDLKQVDPEGAPFSFIEIDHYAANTQLPEYTVIVKANGQGIFEGKRNVGATGKVEFEISASTINGLSELFIHSNFMSMTKEALWSPDLPINSISYAINRGPVGVKTLHDDNLNPAELVSLRNKVEELLGISKFVKKQIQTATVSAVAIN